MKKSAMFEWYKRFKEEQEDMKNGGRSGRPKTHHRCKHVKKIR